MLLMKQVLDHLRLFLAPIQMAAHGGHEFGPIGRPAFAEPVGLDVLIQQFIGVQFRAVARHPNEPQPLLVLVHKVLGGAGSMCRMPVHDQIDVAGDLFEQSLHERHKDGCLELALKHHEGQAPLVRDGGDHIAPKPLAGGAHNRSLSQRGIARPRHVVTAQPHLVAPINRGVVPPGLPGDCRVFSPQPMRDSRIVPLVGAPHRLLRAQAPGLEIATHGDQGHGNPVFAHDQARHRRPRPEIERQLQLIRQRAHDHRADARRALPAQASLTRAPSPALECQGSQPAFPVEPPPLADRSQARPERARRLGLRHSAANRLHHLSTQQVQRRRLQGPGIRASGHARMIAYYALFSELISN